MVGTTDPTRRERDLVASFVELADTLVEDFDIVDLLHQLSERVVELGLAREAGILLAGDDGILRVMAASTEPIHLLEVLQLQNREGPCLDCFRGGRPVRVDDLAAQSDRWPTFVPAALHVGVGSVLAVPLRLRSETLGAMGLFRGDGPPIDDEEIAVAQALADVASIGLLQHRGKSTAERTSEQLRYALESRVSIEQAKGVLAERMDIEVDVAFELLRGHARRTNQRLSDVARDVVDGIVDSVAREP